MNKLFVTAAAAALSVSAALAQAPGVALGSFAAPTAAAAPAAATIVGAIRVAYVQNRRGQFWYGASSRPDAAKAEEVALAECLAHATDGRQGSGIRCELIFSQDGGYAALAEGRHSATQVRGILIEGSMQSLEDAVAKVRAKAGPNATIKCISSLQRVWADCPDKAANK